MRIKGYEDASFKRQTKHTLTFLTKDGKEIKVDLLLTSLPYGYETFLEKELPFPSPPKVQAKTTDGKSRFKPNGDPIMEPDIENPDYKKRYEEMREIRTIACIALGLREDTTLEFITKKEDYIPEIGEKPKKQGGFKAYYKALLKEIWEADFPFGELASIDMKLQKISGLQTAMKERATDFL